MTDEVDLIRAIADAPEEDLPRLLYADWLDEFAADRPGAREFAKYVRAAVVAARPKPSLVPPPVAIGAAREVDFHRAAGEWHLSLSEWREARRVETDLRFQACQYLRKFGLSTNWASGDIVRGFPHWYGFGVLEWLGLGPGLVNLLPVYQISWADKRPHTLVWLNESAGTVRSWLDRGSQYLTPEDQRACSLPECLFVRLKGYQPNVPVVRYTTEADAFSDLSRAALLWARNS